MIETGIYQALRDDATVGAMVGTKIFPVMMQENTLLPAIVFCFVSRGSVNSLEGANPLEFGHVQFDCYARDHASTKLLSQAVKARLVPMNDAGGFPYELPDGTEIQSAIVHNDMDNPFEIGEGGTGYVFRALLEIEFGFIPAT